MPLLRLSSNGSAWATRGLPWSHACFRLGHQKKAEKTDASLVVAKAHHFSYYCLVVPPRDRWCHQSAIDRLNRPRPEYCGEMSLVRYIPKKSLVIQVQEFRSAMRSIEYHRTGGDSRTDQLSQLGRRHCRCLELRESICRTGVRLEWVEGDV